MATANILPSECRICGVPAYYLYYGVKACEPCKVFFRRNAEKHKNNLKCHFDARCEVNTSNRHVCSACRLAKCFKVGMHVEMIRPSRSIKRKAESVSSTLRWNYHKPYQISTLSLLERDQSLFSTDQWTLISNLIHLYDEHNALQTTRNFMKELDALHPKIRFKTTQTKILDITSVFYRTSEPFILSNHDFASISFLDRSIILRGAVDNLTCLGGGFLLHQSGLIKDLAFRHALEMTFGTIPYQLTLIIVSLLDEDVNIMKLALSIFAFCANQCTIFDPNIPLIYLTDQHALIQIQNTYAELTWKYLLYRYSFQQAVRRFSLLVKCLVTALTVRTHLQTVTNHTHAVNMITEKIEQQQLTMDET